MQRHSAIERDTIPVRVHDQEARLRLLYENPSDEFGWGCQFGVRESFGTNLLLRVHVEPYAVPKGQSESLDTLVGNFFDRAQIFKESMDEGLFVYWMIVRIPVPREDREATVMPAMACAVFTPQHTLECRFDSLLRDPDASEAKQMTFAASNAARVLPVAHGAKNSRECAHVLMETVHEGLRIGYELSAPDKFDARKFSKPN